MLNINYIHMHISEDKTVGEIVALDYRTAALFEKFGIDFCCKGNISITDICKNKNISSNYLLDELNKVVNEKNATTVDYNSWPIDLLAEYIEKKHHRYVEEKIPVLKQFLQKLCQVHGNKHPELYKINELFNETAGELAAHMKKEELIIFPFIRKIVASKKENIPLAKPVFKSIQNPILIMKMNHDTEGERFRRIADLSRNYNPPHDACNTYKVTYALLKEFEQDLHLHIHLENNLLFPKAIEMEKTLR